MHFSRFLNVCAIVLAGIISNNSHAQMDIDLHKNGAIDLICDGQKYCFNNLTEFANDFNQSNNYLESKSIVKSKEKDNVIIFKKIHSIGNKLCKLNLRSDANYKPRLVFYLFDNPLILEKISNDSNLSYSIYTNNTRFEFGIEPRN